MSSVIGEIGNIGQANYAASKSGLFGLTKTLAKEVAFMLERAGKLTDDGLAVTVNTVTPGFIATEMVETIPEKVIDKIKGQIPMRRLGRPKRSRASFTSSPPTPPPTSPDRYGESTAEWTCDAPQIPSGQAKSTDEGLPAAGQPVQTACSIRSNMPRPACLPRDADTLARAPRSDPPHARPAGAGTASSIAWLSATSSSASDPGMPG